MSKISVPIDPDKVKREFEELAKEREAELKRFHDIPAVYGDLEIETQAIMLPMEDGTPLKTYIVRPKGIAPIPVLVQRTPYAGQIDMFLKILPEYARHGFACVVQSCRGTGESQGEWVPNIYERGDGLFTLNWLNDLEWVESIGYHGASYLSYTGWSMADAVPNKVKGMYLSVYGTDRHASAYKDGLFRQDILTAWAMGNAGKPVEADLYDSYTYKPQVQVDRDMWKVDLPWYRDWITHTDYTDPYWKTGVWKELKAMPGKLRIPIVLEEGWYDHHLGGALIGYRDMPKEIREHSLLRIGAWRHSSQPALEGRVCSDLQNDSIFPIYNFFKTLLIDKEEPKPGVLLYQINEDTWIHTQDWPIPAGIADFYLNAGTGELRQVAAEEEQQISYIYDPENPVISYGSESCFQSMSIVGSLEQPKPGYREDVISFVSQPLDKDIRIVGSISADLYVKSDAEDTAFTIKVMEEFADGHTYNIRTGITTLAYRGHSDTRQTYKPGDVIKLNIDTWDIAWTLQKGSKLRVDISSSDFPQYAVHSNYPGIWSMQEKCKTAEQTLLTGGSYPSVLHIPYIE